MLDPAHTLAVTLEHSRQEVDALRAALAAIQCAYLHAAYAHDPVMDELMLARIGAIVAEVLGPVWTAANEREGGS